MSTPDRFADLTAAVADLLAVGGRPVGVALVRRGVALRDDGQAAEGAVLAALAGELLEPATTWSGLLGAAIDGLTDDQAAGLGRALVRHALRRHDDGAPAEATMYLELGHLLLDVDSEAAYEQETLARLDPDTGPGDLLAGAEGWVGDDDIWGVLDQLGLGEGWVPAADLDE